MGCQGCVQIVGVIIAGQPNQYTKWVFFMPRDEVHTVHSNWLLTLTMDTQPYRAHLDLLRQEMRQFQQALHFVRYQGEKVGNETGYGAYHMQIQYELENELDKFRSHYYNLWDVFGEVLLVLNTEVKGESRRKRAILPGVGSILSFLFGTATQANLDHIRDMIVKLGSSQEEIIHVVESSVSILNKTHTAVEENRQVINLLRNATVKFQSKLAELTRKMLNIQAEVSYIELITSIHGFTHTLSDAMQKATWVLEKLLWKINSVVQGEFMESVTFNFNDEGY